MSKKLSLRRSSNASMGSSSSNGLTRTQITTLLRRMSDSSGSGPSPSLTLLGNSFKSRKKPRTDTAVSMGKKKGKTIRTNSATEVKSNKNLVILNKKQPKGKTAGKWKFTQLSQTITKSEAGLQQVSGVFRVCSKNAGLVTSVDPGGTPFATITNLAELNPYKRITGSNLHTAASSPATDKFMIKTIDVELEVVNGENTPCVFDLYFVTPKSNTDKSFKDCFNDALTKEGPAGQIVVAYPGPGLTVPALSVKTGGFSKFDFAGQEPFKFKTVRDNFRLLKKRTVHMSVGVNEIIKTKILYNKVIDVESLRELADIEDYRNTTINCWVIQRGTVGFDVTVAESHKCTYSPSTLGFVQSITYNMCGVYANAGRVDVNYVGACIPTNTADAFMKHIDEDTETATAQVSLGN